MKKTLTTLAGALLLLLTASNTAMAIPITGSISFFGAPNFNSPNIATATTIVSYDNAKVAPLQEFGSYASVPGLTDVTFTPFTFSPPVQVINPLWTFTLGAITYSFTTTSTIALFDSALNIWNIGGNGVLHITGFDDTAGKWNFSTGQIGDSFYFGSAAAAAGVPDGASTALMLGLGLGLIAISSVGRFRKIIM